MICAQPAVAEPYPLRWYLCNCNFDVERNVVRAIELARSAAASGYNGVVVGDGKFFRLEVDGLDRPGSRYVRNIERFKQACRDAGLEIIPTAYVISHASSILAQNPNLAAGHEVRGATYEVHDRIAKLVPDKQTFLVDGGFEDTTLDRLSGWSTQDAPGRATIPDRQVRKFGKQSVRLEASGAKKLGMCRLSQHVKVKPRSYYRVSVWVKTEALSPPRAFNIGVRGEDETGALRYLSYAGFTTKTTQDWTREEIVFNSFNCRDVIVYMGLWKAQSGRAWLDGAEISEIGLVNVLNRPGCPVRITSEDGSIVYRERYDYEPVRDPKLGRAKFAGTFDRYHDEPTIRMRPDFADGQRLSVSYYHALPTTRNRVDCCLSDPHADEIFERSFRRLNNLFDGPKRYLLTYSEIRTGGGCERCRGSGKTPGQLLADNVRRIKTIAQRIRPGAEFVVWHDVFDPNSNAVDNYYLVQGSLAGSWEGLDDDFTVLAWPNGSIDGTLRFFSQRGIRLIPAPSFDEPTDPLSFAESWIVKADAVTRVEGLLYKTEQNRYEFLESFGRMLTNHERPNYQRN